MLDRAVLDASPREVLRTHTPWTRGPQLFEGRPLLPLLPEALLRAPLLVAVGLDDYRAEIPAEDVQRHGLFLAWRRNGVLLTVRDRGPFWLLYPWSARPGLDLPLFHRRAVWQLRLIEAA
ncbi:MAG: hypothetical protein RMK64_14470 [Rhodovarius sp.]|nr:hypothetical protein [Rhodovarius sp.]